MRKIKAKQTLLIKKTLKDQSEATSAYSRNKKDQILLIPYIRRLKQNKLFLLKT
jgi:hypothetical protein